MLDFNRISDIKNKDDFLEFMRIIKEYDDEKDSIKEYLEGIISWVEDMEGFYINMNKNVPADVNWSFLATLFYVGKIYE